MMNYFGADYLDNLLETVQGQKNEVIIAVENHDVTNNKAKTMLEKLYNKTVHGIYADGLSREDGIINCCTWQYYE